MLGGKLGYVAPDRGDYSGAEWFVQLCMQVRWCISLEGKSCMPAYLCAQLYVQATNIRVGVVWAKVAQKKLGQATQCLARFASTHTSKQTDANLLSLKIVDIGRCLNQLIQCVPKKLIPTRLGAGFV